MLKRIFFIALIFLSALQTQAFEDCIITTKGALYNIRIENHDIIDVYPLIDITNKKNVLIVHPMKVGTTAFSVMKNGKTKHLFLVKVEENSTTIKGDDDFSILTLDSPPIGESFELDLPPLNIIKKEAE